MNDIYWAISGVLSVAFVAGLVAFFVTRRTGRVAGATLAAICVAGVIFNLVMFHDRLWPARWLPYSNLIVLADFNPLLVAILCGCAAAVFPGSPARRSVLITPLIMLCLFASYRPLFAHPPKLGDKWKSGVCRQTSSASCVPAAVATLLSSRGISATEAEMARFCLTSTDGTALRGAYRGLKIKAADTPYRVEVFTGDLATLPTAPLPMLLPVRLDKGPDIDPRYERDWGWAPGVAHCVVLFRVLPDGRCEIGDPAVGREFWSREAIKTLWHGEGIALVR